tara:strand:- start:50 stop:208 length:159 start_codon:yes stop_codon:yes gene_type:complete
MKYISNQTRKKDLLKTLEGITKKEIEWSTSDLESDDWSKLHDHILRLQKKYI